MFLQYHEFRSVIILCVSLGVNVAKTVVVPLLKDSLEFIHVGCLKKLYLCCMCHLDNVYVRLKIKFCLRCFD